MKIPTAAILVIGDEILSGKTAECNAQFLIGELRELGVALKRIVIISDEIAEVARHTRELSDSFDYVFTSGGVGPTHDDVTIVGIAQAFDAPVTRHPELERRLKSYFGEHADAAKLRMAEVPEGAHLIDGEGLKWPLLAVRNVYVLPGVPEHFRKKFVAIRERFRVAPFFTRVFFTLEDEFDIAANLTALAARHPDVAIGSYPNFATPDYQVKLTLEAKDETVLQAAAAAMLEMLDAARLVRSE